MNNVTPERKQSVLKSLAIVGLLGVIIIIAWLSVQIVNVLPNALNSLASLADSVYSYDPKGIKSIELKPIAGPVNVGDTVILSWDKPLQTGFYAFNYECAEGLSIEIKTAESDFKSASCNTSYNLGSVETAQLIINSEKKPELDVNYSIAYFKTNEGTPAVEVKQSVLVTNPRFNEETTTPNEVTVNDETITVTETEVEVKEEEDEPVITEVKPVPKPSTPKPTTPEYEYVYSLPVSNPAGFTDLAVSYKGVGKTNSAGAFIDTVVLYKDVAGAIQFSVQNIGTKTSDSWYYTASLPGGRTYESEKQIPLKPNEKATLTFSFSGISDIELQTFSLEIETEGDSNSSNDKTTWSTIVIR